MSNFKLSYFWGRLHFWGRLQEWEVYTVTILNERLPLTIKNLYAFHKIDHVKSNDF